MKDCSLFPEDDPPQIQYRRNRLAKANAALQELEERTPEENSQRYKDQINLLMISVPYPVSKAYNSQVGVEGI
ncbi:hypothetical protein PO124_02020 [Bacillus licheniformis]|nr:hypothetical protein [Bacillus licheniformis]